MGNPRTTGPDYIGMTDAQFKKLNKDMHNTAKKGGSVSQATQNKYALELSRRSKNNKDGTYSVRTNKDLSKKPKK